MTAFDHRQAIELLPWYLNGTLSEQERQSVERHLRTCLPCRSALRDEQELHALIRRPEANSPAVRHGFGQLLSRIERSDRESSARFPARPIVAGAAAAAVIVAVAAAWLIENPDPGLTGEPTGAYRTLTESGASSDRIDIVFDAGMSPGAVDAFVESFGGNLVAGPSELGRYTVSVTVASEQELADLIERIGQDVRVRFAGRNFIDPPRADEETP